MQRLTSVACHFSKIDDSQQNGGGGGGSKEGDEEEGGRGEAECRTEKEERRTANNAPIGWTHTKVEK